MTNKNGPKDATRKLLSSVIHSQMLYAAPILAAEIKKKSAIEQLLKPQRITSLRVISAYRTVSASAALVLAGIPPIDLQIMEREEISSKLIQITDLERYNEYIRLVKREARENLLTKWQERWDSDETGRWNHKLIPNIKCWIKRKSGNTDYYLTQFLTGHGKFNSYLKRFRIREEDCDDCHYELDNAEHAIFQCFKWDEMRLTLNQNVGAILNPENIVLEMLKSENTWRRCHNFIVHIMQSRCNRNSEALISPGRYEFDMESSF